MPDMKHVFTGGKMNKDLDERLIPKDQYKNAVNVQVSSSDDSDVGTIQNILGNEAVELPIVKPNLKGGEQIYNCVGSISDEKNDTSYWFLSGQRIENDFQFLHSISDQVSIQTSTNPAIRDYIISRKKISTPANPNVYENSIVFTDYKSILSRTEDPNVFPAILNLSTLRIAIPSANIGNISKGDVLLNIVDEFGMVSPQKGKVTLVFNSGSNVPGSSYIIIDKFTDTNFLSFSTGSYLALEFATGNLMFDHDNLINGINIIDDLLFWTDSENEPKVINIDRCAGGTDQDGFLPTQLLNLNLPSTTPRRIIPSDIQVIKRKPTQKLTIDYSLDRRAGILQGFSEASFNNNNALLFEPGYEGTIKITSISPGNALSYNIGDIILILNEDDIDSGQRILPYEYDVKIIIKSISTNYGTYESIINYELISISANTPLTAPSGFLPFQTVLQQQTSSKFENEMMRFSYRYRYLDKEVSALAPFTDAAFQPSEFLYNQKNAYNYGMINTITSLKLKDFIDVDNTLGLESVDLLVKFEASPLVYVIDTIHRKDFPVKVNKTQSPLLGEYQFNPKSIKGVLPENQMLRPWDAVPTLAKAQEIVGNRIVYANYTFGYDFSLADLDLKITPSVRPIDIIQELDGAPSIKSKRNYQVGLVYLDEEGRESPVFSNADASINIPKSSCGTNSMLSVTNKTQSPTWAKSYKYYVKDSSLPAHNIVVDAFYRAENGDFWIAAPSSERNKIQVGDFLELKKGINSNKPVELDITTKAISIENEAPDFIKTKYRRLGKSPFSSGGLNLFDIANAEPRVGSDSFKINKEFWLQQHSAGFGGGGELDREGLNDLSVIFSAADSSALGGVYKSRRYPCGRIGLYLSDNYTIKLDEVIRDEDDWIAPTSVTPIITNTALRLEVFEKIIIPNAEFEGKFFIKIEAKEDLIPNLVPDDVTKGYETKLKEFNVFNFSESEGGAAALGGVNNGIGTTIANTVPLDASNFGAISTTTNFGAVPINLVQMDSYDRWSSFLQYHTLSSGIKANGYWFIDRLRYKAVQEDSSMPSLDPMGTANFGLGVFKSNSTHLGNYNTNSYYMGPNSPIVTQAGRYFMELSVVGCFGEISVTPNGGDVSEGWHQYWTKVGAANWPLNASAFDANNVNLEILEFLKTPSQQFKFEGGSEVFTIVNSHLEKRFNYADGTLAQNEAYDEYEHIIDPSNPLPGDDRRREFLDPLNRRLTVVLELDKNPLAYDGIDLTDSSQANAYSPVNMIFIEQNFNVEVGEGLRTSNPAVFELEKIDEEKLDIYYEASDEIPIQLTVDALKRFIPIGSKVTYPGDPSMFIDVTVGEYAALNSPNNSSNAVLLLDNLSPTNSVHNDLLGLLLTEDKLAFTTPNGNVIYLRLQDAEGWQGAFTPFGYKPRIWPATNTIGNTCNIGLSWSNCIAFRNGVESVYLKDTFNKPFLNKGVKVSSSLQGEYKRETKTNGLIYSGLYNDNSETNNLNQFIQAEKITKEINPTYGSIQKLHTRDTDLITLCEDKVLKILANKDAVFNADGNTQLTATENVLGQTIPFSGEYGISKNPESFASESYRAYFTDKARGAVMRLSKDGLTAISEHGMKDWFRDHLKLSNLLIGSYDDYKSEYNLSLVDLPSDSKYHTVSFKENVRGWVSFKSFKPENGLSTTNTYHTFKNSTIWQHHSENVDRNTFYNVFKPSEFEVILNDSPGVVKKFHTLNYEGSESRIVPLQEYDTYQPGTTTVLNTYNDLDYYNLNERDGWYVEKIFTNKEEGGSLLEFIEKEGKWFNYIRGKKATSASGSVLRSSSSASSNIIDSGDISFQGLGRVVGTPVVSWVYGCTDPTASNYNSTATYDNGTCVPCIYGCDDPSATNYDVSATCNDGSCFINGCTNPIAFNYNSLATADDGSCIAVVLGCTDATALNYNASANTDDGSCIAVVRGCTDASAVNYDPTANDNDGSCLYAGCTDSNALNYDSGANFDDGSCAYPAGCNDDNALTYDLSDNNADGCFYCKQCENAAASHSHASATTAEITISFDPPTVDAQNATIDDYIVDIGVAAAGGSVYLPWSAPTYDYNAQQWVYPTLGATWNNLNVNASYHVTPSSNTMNIAFTYPNMAASTEYHVYITPLCINDQNDLTQNIGTADPIVITGIQPLDPTLGCTDSAAINYDINATFDDGSCIAVVLGCTNSSAPNFDPTANTEDGSCQGITYGCLDPNAGNYNINATMQDPINPCTYTPVIGDTGTGDNTNDGLTDLTDLTVVINSWLQTVPDGTAGDVYGSIDGFVGIFDLITVLNNFLDSNVSENNPVTNNYFVGLYMEETASFNTNMLINGTCDSGADIYNINGWNLSSGGNSTVLGTGDLVKFYMEPNPSGTTNGKMTQYVNFVDGEEYEITLDITHTAGTTGTNRAVFIQDSMSANSSSGLYETKYLQNNANIGVTQTLTYTWIANSASSYIEIQGHPQTTDQYWFEIDNIIVKKTGIPVGLEDYSTYRLYAKFRNPTTYTWNSATDVNDSVIMTIYSKSGVSNEVSSTSDFFNSDLFGDISNLQGEVNDGAFSFYPLLEYDTWIALGDSYSDTMNTVGDVGLGADLSGSSWTFGGGANSDAAIHKNGNIIYPDNDGKILLGQFTTAGDLSGHMSFSGSVKDTDSLSSTYNQMCPYTIENALFTVIRLDDTPGCTDSSANNYDSNADVDDGSCAY